MGSSNYPDIDWLTLSSTNFNSSLFCALIFDINFIQLIETPTHTAGNILDLVLTNYDCGIQNLTVDSTLFPQLSSDHFMIKFDVICEAGPSAKTTYSNQLNYSKANWKVYTNSFHNIILVPYLPFTTLTLSGYLLKTLSWRPYTGSLHVLDISLTVDQGGSPPKFNIS